jgi:hypothetical protein
MKTGQKSFRTFEDLEAYQAAREFRKTVYAVSRRLPDFERFELASQIRRAAVSLTNNIAEGHGRYHYRKAGASLALHESSPAYGLTDEELDAALVNPPLHGLAV